MPNNETLLKYIYKISRIIGLRTHKGRVSLAVSANFLEVDKPDFFISQLPAVSSAL